MAKNNQKSSDNEMTFFEHIDALRPHLMRGALVILVLVLVVFLAKGFIIDTILFGPQSVDFPTNRFFCYVGSKLGIDELCMGQLKFNMINTSMAGQFNLHMKVSMVGAIVLGIPYLLMEIWAFVRPALTPFERRKSRMFVFYVSLCFFAGLLFGYYLIAPLTINFFNGYNASRYITNMIDVNSYLSTVLGVSLASAAVFQLPLLIYFLARMGVISSSFMKKYRKHALVLLLVFSAIITPPDLFSQILVALPLYGLYEFSIWLAKRVEVRKDKEEEAERLKAVVPAGPGQGPDGPGGSGAAGGPGGAGVSGTPAGAGASGVLSGAGATDGHEVSADKGSAAQVSAGDGPAAEGVVAGDDETPVTGTPDKGTGEASGFDDGAEPEDDDEALHDEDYDEDRFR